MTADTITERRVTPAQFDRLADWSMRKPVIAIMGEFSSGKSTLMNLLIGQNVLPTQVTATRMPPVWLTYGTEAPYRVDHNGRKHKVNFNKPDSIPIRTTSYIRLFVEADILKHCDLIDTPGISDPNIKTENWIRTVRYANAVMWCTIAGQAWRESERGSWESLPRRLRETSILLVTRKDKIASERDLLKIRRRLERETENLFNSRMFISLTGALKAFENDDAEAWEKSGGKSFTDMLEQIVEGISVQRSYMLSRYVIDRSGTVPEPLADTSGAHVPEPEKTSEPDFAPEMTAGPDDAKPEGRDQEVAAGATRNEPEAPVEDPVETAPQAEISAAETAPEEDEAPAIIPAQNTLDIHSYILNDPAAYRGNRQNVDLSNYHLRNPSSFEPPVQNKSQEPEPVRRADPVPARSPGEAVAEKTEVDMIREMWSQICNQFDLSQTPTLAHTVDKLIDQMSHEADAAKQERKSA